MMMGHVTHLLDKLQTKPSTGPSDQVNACKIAAHLTGSIWRVTSKAGLVVSRNDDLI